MKKNIYIYIFLLFFLSNNFFYSIALTETFTDKVLDNEDESLSWYSWLEKQKGKIFIITVLTFFIGFFYFSDGESPDLFFSEKIDIKSPKIINYFSLNLDYNQTMSLLFYIKTLLKPHIFNVFIKTLNKINEENILLTPEKFLQIFLNEEFLNNCSDKESYINLIKSLIEK